MREEEGVGGGGGGSHMSVNLERWGDVATYFTGGRVYLFTEWVGQWVVEWVGGWRPLFLAFIYSFRFGFYFWFIELVSATMGHPFFFWVGFGG